MSSSEEEDSSRDGEGTEQRRKQLEPPDEDTLRILVSTDNHLGYLERDPVRGLDSFAAFEEVLYLAKRYKADMVLIAGDLFHDNKPSRNTLHKTMEIIRRYCMGPDPVQIQIVSNQETNFRSLNGTVNYEDEFYSIDLPVFSIHGNHDDPTRDGGGETLAALDLLSVSNLVNYFGRQDMVDKVEVAPVLIRKGSTNVALYGMGSMRDERLNRMWQSKKISFLRPETDVAGEEQQNEDEIWFNLFTLHQNRDTGRGAKNCIHESMIPEWFDLVVWGHEHECLIDPMESTVGTFRIIQPGSSVATSLTPGEAIRKQVGVLDIKGRQFRQTPVPLTQVRSFFMAEMSLRERPELDADDPKVDGKISKVLEDQVNVLIYEAKQKRKHLRKDADGLGNSPKDVEDKIKYTLAKPDEVLIRLKVDHSNFSIVNNQRFGSKFVGQVGNPTDILLFARRKGESSGKSGKKKSASSLDMPVLPEDPGELKVEALIAQGLEASGNRLEILEETKLHSALEMYVEKDGKSAIEDTFSGLLSRQQKALEKRRGNDASLDESVDVSAVDASASRDLDSEEDDVKENRSGTNPPGSTKRPSQMDLDDSFDDEVVPAPRKASSSQRSRRTTQKIKESSVLSISDDEDDDFDATPAPSRSRGKRARAKPRYRAESDDESDAVISVGDEDDELDDMEDEIVEVKPTKRRGAKKTAPASSSRKKTPAAKKSTTSKKSTAKKASGSSSARMTQLSLSFPSYTKSSTTKKKPTKRKRRVVNSSDDEDGGFGSYGAPKDWGTASTNTQR